MQAQYLALGICILLVNILGFIMAGDDKRKARSGKRRIPEKVFLAAALLGGATGVYLGMKTFRHKTRKPLFSWGMPLLIILNITLVIVILGQFL